MSYLFKINKAYDGIEEPVRFLLMLVVMSPWFVALALYKSLPVLMLIGALYITIIFLFRWLYVTKLVKK